MAVVMEAYNLNTSGKDRLPQPIVFCRPEPEVMALSIPLNVTLAKKLIALKPGIRTARLEKCFRQILDTLPEDPIVRDFDVLFNPKYKVDVLQLMDSVGKDKPFRIVWPGKYENGRLIYANEGYVDYKVFEISRYNITCIV